MCLAGSCLSIAKGGATKAFYCHLDDPFNSRVIKDVGLRCSRLKDNIIRKNTTRITGIIYIIIVVIIIIIGILFLLRRGGGAFNLGL